MLEQENETNSQSQAEEPGDLEAEAIIATEGAEVEAEQVFRPALHSSHLYSHLHNKH
jgi:hypothetical protein